VQKSKSALSIKSKSVKWRGTFLSYGISRNIEFTLESDLCNSTLSTFWESTQIQSVAFKSSSSEISRRSFLSESQDYKLHSEIFWAYSTICWHWSDASSFWILFSESSSRISSTIWFYGSIRCSKKCLLPKREFLPEHSDAESRFKRVSWAGSWFSFWELYMFQLSRLLSM
jgi:hypothetical protein